MHEVKYNGHIFVGDIESIKVVYSEYGVSTRGERPPRHASYEITMFEVNLQCDMRFFVESLSDIKECE